MSDLSGLRARVVCAGVAAVAAGALLASSARAQDPAPKPAPTVVSPPAPPPPPKPIPELAPPTERTTESEVVTAAIENNPSLKASVLELQDARWALIGEEGRYPFIFEADAGVTRTARPDRFVNESDESYAIDVGTGIRKHLVWGTDLSLRLAGSWVVAEEAVITDPPTPVVEGMVPETEIGPPTYGVVLRFSVVQPLLRGAGREIGEADLLAARLRRTAAEHARDRAASDLLRAVLTAYWDLWYTTAALGIQEQSRALAVRQRDDAAARVNGGSLAPAEVFPFETRVATREEDVLTAQIEAQRRQTELAEQAGILGKRAALGLPSESVPPTPAPSAGDVEKAALAESPQLRELEASLELARVQARTADDPQRARLDLDAYVQAEGAGYDAPGRTLQQFGTLGAVSAHVGLTFETPLDDSRRRADAARARLAVDIAAQRLEAARQALRSEVRVAVAREAAARRRLELAEETARIAALQLAAEQARFEGGSSTPLAVLEAEETLRSAQLRVARARSDLLTSNLAIQHLTGRLLDRYAKVVDRAAPRTGARRGRPVALTPRVGKF